MEQFESDLAGFLSHRTVRKYLDQAIDSSLLDTLCACALSSPSKSDLQQADILIVKSPDLRKKLCALLPDQVWMAKAPAFLIFLANRRRLPEMARIREKPFPNDHLDAFLTAASMRPSQWRPSFMRQSVSGWVAARSA